MQDDGNLVVYKNDRSTAIFCTSVGCGNGGASYDTFNGGWSPCFSDDDARATGYQNRDAAGAGFCRNNPWRAYEGVAPNKFEWCSIGKYRFKCADTSYRQSDGDYWSPCYRNEDAVALGKASRDAQGLQWCLDAKYSRVGTSRDCGNWYIQFRCEYWSGCYSDDEARGKNFPNRDAAGAADCRGTGPKGKAPFDFEGADPAINERCKVINGDYSHFTLKCRSTSSDPWSACYRNEDGLVLGVTNRAGAGTRWCKDRGYSEWVDYRDCGNDYGQFFCELWSDCFNNPKPADREKKKKKKKTQRIWQATIITNVAVHPRTHQVGSGNQGGHAGGAPAAKGGSGSSQGGPVGWVGAPALARAILEPDEAALGGVLEQEADQAGQERHRRRHVPVHNELRGALCQKAQLVRFRGRAVRVVEGKRC
jgi:hypothetical protein